MDWVEASTEGNLCLHFGVHFRMQIPVIVLPVFKQRIHSLYSKSKKELALHAMSCLLEQHGIIMFIVCSE